MSAVSEALMTPARPLFIGRKPCLPSTRLFVGVIADADNLTDALTCVPVTFPDRWPEIAGQDGRTEVMAEWPVVDRNLPVDARSSQHRVIDQRDWRNQLHGGERVVARGTLVLNCMDAPASGGAS